MYSRYKTAILKPSRIPLYINKKLISFLYFLILGLIYILPNLIYVISTGGIDNSYFIDIVNEIRNEEINYVIEDHTLKTVSSEKTDNSFNTESIQITFTNITEVELEQDLTTRFKEIGSYSEAPIKLVFTEKQIIGIFSYQGALINLPLGSYQELEVSDLALFNTANETILNGFSRILHSLHEKYEILIIGVTIPSLIIGGYLGLALILLIPSFVLYIFNRGLGIKFGTIYHMSIYAFTIYILGCSLLFRYSTTFITLIFEIISFVYLSIAMRSYYIYKSGGIRREL